MNNDLINELNNKIDAQDKIINTQVLEIANLKEDKETLVLTIKTILKDKEELEQKIDKARDYINKRMVHEGEYYFRKAKHFKNTEFGKDLLQLLGDKENE